MLPALRFALPFAYGALTAIGNSLLLITFCAATLAGVANAAPKTIVALGDSLTAGYGLPPEGGLIAQLQSWLASHGADVTLINAGVSGDTTAGGLARLDWSLTADTQALIVNLGGNDMLRGIDPANARSNLDAILSTAQARNLPTLLIALPAPGNYGPEYKTDFDALYPALAKQYGASLMPNYFAALDTGSGSADQGLMQDDGIHPNAAGVSRIVETLGPYVLELAAKIPSAD